MSDPAITPASLADSIASFVIDEGNALIEHFMPEDRIPGFLAGYPSFKATTSMYVQLLAALHKLGVKQVGRRSIEERMVRLLGDVDPDAYKTWWSLFLAEAVQAFGPRWDSNPLVQALDPGQRDRLARAIDSSHVVDLNAGQLIGHPNNYWMVMAKLESARLAMGLTDDGRILELAMGKTRQTLLQNDHGYLDDSENFTGRYDSYIVSTVCEAAPLFRAWPHDEVQRILEALQHLLLTCVHPNGAHAVWGRSASGDSVHRTTVLAATLLSHLDGGPRQRLLGLAAHAFDETRRHWWADHYMTDHRRGKVHWYLGPGRLIERGLCRLVSLADSTLQLRQLAQREPNLTALTDPKALFPHHNTWLAFDKRGHGIWSYHAPELSFQVPLVDGFTSCYAAAPIWPGSIEQIVDSGMACGIPNILIKGKRYLPLTPPSEVRYEGNSLSWTNAGWVHWTDWDWWKGREELTGRRRVELKVEGDTLVGQETWELPEAVTAVGFWFAQSDTPLRVNWTTAHEHHATTVVVDGLPDWRGGFGPIRKLHQIDLIPARQMQVQYRLSRGG